MIRRKKPTYFLFSPVFRLTLFVSWFILFYYWYQHKYHAFFLQSVCLFCHFWFVCCFILCGVFFWFKMYCIHSLILFLLHLLFSAPFLQSFCSFTPLFCQHRVWHRYTSYLCFFMFLFSSVHTIPCICLFSPPLCFLIHPLLSLYINHVVFLLHLPLPGWAGCLFGAPFITKGHFYNHSLSWALYHGIIFLPNPHSLAFIHLAAYQTLLPHSLHFILPSFALSPLLKMDVWKDTRKSVSLYLLLSPDLKRMNIFYYQLCMCVENCPSVISYVIFSFASCHFGLYPLIRFRGEQMWFIL